MTQEKRQVIPDEPAFDYRVPRDTQKEVIEAYPQVFSHPLAGVVIYDIALKGHYLTLPVPRDEVDALKMEYLVGRRSLAERIIRLSGFENAIIEILNPSLWRKHVRR